MEVHDFDDVDDYISDAEIHTTGPQSQALDLLKVGNIAFRSCHFDEAIRDYSRASKLQPLVSPIVLSNRSAAFCKLSQNLREIPAATSEKYALFGLDPMSHAELALKDAEKVVKLHSTWLKGYYRKAAALILLERYHEARDSLLTGLELDPTSFPLQSALRQIDAEIHKDSMELSNDLGQNKKREKIQSTDDFDCVLCLKLLYNPVTTPCGHSFCRGCLLQAMDHGNKCPICRVVLFLSPKTYPLSVVLKNILEKNFPEEYAARKEEMDSLSLSDGREILPFFVLNFVIPCEKMGLNVFEPRYRLMVRRVMEGDHRMGMVGIDPETGAIADVACEVEITECNPLPDGRFYLEVEGRRRCKIIKSWEQDGYRVGQVTWLADTVCSDGSLQQELQELARSTADMAKSWITRSLQTSQIGILDQAGGMPDTKDPELFSFWVAKLLHLRPADKLHLLRLTNTRERLLQDLIFLRSGTHRGYCLQ